MHEEEVLKKNKSTFKSNRVSQNSGQCIWRNLLKGFIGWSKDGVGSLVLQQTGETSGSNCSLNEKGKRSFNVPFILHKIKSLLNQQFPSIYP